MGKPIAINSVFVFGQEFRDETVLNDVVSIEDQNLGIPKSNLPIASYTSVQPVQVSVMAWLTLKGRHKEKKNVYKGSLICYRALRILILNCFVKITAALSAG